jgi:uncharacterized cupin superfamily protein
MVLSGRWRVESGEWRVESGEWERPRIASERMEETPRVGAKKVAGGNPMRSGGFAARERREGKGER